MGGYTHIGHTEQELPWARARTPADGERNVTMKNEDLTPDQMQMALTSFREWAKQVVIALGDEPTFDYDYDRVPGKIEDLRRQLAEPKAAVPASSHQE
jgi:hypothetical protein